MELWIPVSIAAAFFQNLRSALQKHLKGRLSTTGAAYARFIYALPLALLYVVGLSYIGGYELPTPNAKFFLYCLLGGVSQILFTVLLLWMFSFRSFVVGTTISKLEVVMIAILGALILDDHLNGYAIIAIIISAIGLLALSMGQSKMTFSALLSGLTGKDTGIGLICAAFLGASVVFFRGAALSLQHDNIAMAAGYSLAVGLLIQTPLMGLWLALREPGEITRVFTHWRWAGPVGIVGVLASIGWFTAFTLQNASYVRAVGQIELVFTFLFTTQIFKEKVSRLELLGVALVGLGIVLILLAK